MGRDTRRSRFLPVLAVFIGCAAPLSESVADPGTPEERAALFDYIVDATLRRTAFSPYKIDNIGPTPYDTIEELVAAESAELRDEFISADTDEELFYALRKLSSARRDSHLHVYPADENIGLLNYRRGFGGKIEDWTPHAPVKFKPDYGDKEHMRLFVSDYSRSLTEPPAIGDLLVAVNGIAATEYLAELARYHGKSSHESLWWDLAYSLPLKTWFVDPALYDRDRIAFTLQQADGDQYMVEADYTSYGDIDWLGRDTLYTDITRAEYVGRRGDFARQDAERNAWRYDGYQHLFATPGYDCWINDEKRAFLLQWNLFRSDIRDDVQKLVDYAAENDKLDYAIIWDGLNSRGGNYAVWMLQRMQGKPFRTTFGNLRISDITPALADELRDWARGRVDEAGEHADIVPAREIREPDNGRFLLDWLDHDLAKAIQSGQAYSNDVPFKNYYLPKYSDGVVHPADVHFTGPIVLLVGPAGCSQVDQFVSMVVDNGLGYAVGMEAGGCSNTWEWEEDLTFPGRDAPFATYMWTAGHTIRPNGEVLEGNSSPVDVYIPLTRDNYLDYYDLLLTEAYRYIARQHRQAP